MLEVNGAGRLAPAGDGSGRFGAWLENNVDWALSRDRYWGTPLNVWECDADAEHREVIGSYADLAERWGKQLPKDFRPAQTGDRPAHVALQAVRRHDAARAEVIDAWFDSGAMPYAQWHYPFEHQADFKAHFRPISSARASIRRAVWFYSLLAIGVTAFDALVYKNVIVNELVLDAQGQKMSKSRGQRGEPWEVIEEYGADAVRLYLLARARCGWPSGFDRRQIPDVTGGFSTRSAAPTSSSGATRRIGSRLRRPRRHRPKSGRPRIAGCWRDSTKVVGEVRRAWWTRRDRRRPGDHGLRSAKNLSGWYVRRNRPRFGRPAGPPTPWPPRWRDADEVL